MKRRDLVLVLGGTLTSARALRAQQKAMPVIGFLNGGSADRFAPYFDAAAMTSWRPSLAATSGKHGPQKSFSLSCRAIFSATGFGSPNSTRPRFWFRQSGDQTGMPKGQ